MPKMPVKRLHVQLDEIGYEGWWVDLRMNPISEYYDMWFSEDEKVAWEAFGHIVVEWNWEDEVGNPFPLPPEVQPKSLPIDLIPYVTQKYVEALREKAGLPKVPPQVSNGTLQTENFQENGASAVLPPASTSLTSTTEKNVMDAQPVLTSSGV